MVLDNALFDTVRHYRGPAYRNIVSLRTSRNLFSRISDGADDDDAAIAAEMATRARQPRPLINRPFEPWYGVVGFPFIRHHWGASRYSDGSFGVWYGCQTMETTVHETVHHFRQELRDRGWDQHDRPIVRERRVATADVNALVFDLCDKVQQYPDLVHGADYRLTQTVGRAIRDGNHPGLLAPSARHDGGVNIDIFDPKYLSNPQDVCYLRYRHWPDGTVEIEREPGRLWLSLSDTQRET